ncbi:MULTISPECIES: YdaU family protein [unclassified Bartonella]|uniref:YdaU family protein n=1 Tax=unclassified Bartonella TaxID=2645622 RepID=UPI0035D0B698
MKHANQQETPHYESSRLPYVCWYQNDFLGGVRGMRAHEIGIYTILLNEMYARGRPLEISEERLARLCGCDKRTFVNVLEMLIQEGKILNLANGLWNQRCENVFQEREKLLEQKSFAGRSSAKKRKKINTEIQQLLNDRAKDDEQSSEAQKAEEKETPYGVLEKKVLFHETEPCFSCEESFKQSTPSSLSLALPLSSPSQEEVASPENCSSPLNAAQAGFTSASITQIVTEKKTKSPANLPHVNVPSPNLPPSNLPASIPPSSNKKSSTSAIGKGHRLPEHWQADIGAAVSEGLSESQALWQAKKFRDYWQAKSGKEALKVDWQATWRNWFRREIERLEQQKHGSSSSFISESNDILYRSLINYSDNF